MSCIYELGTRIICTLYDVHNGSYKYNIYVHVYMCMYSMYMYMCNFYGNITSGT